MSGKLRVALAVLVMTGMTAVATVVATTVVSASAPKLLFPIGSSKYAAVASMAYASTVSTTFVDVPGLAQTFTIPAGKTADLLVYYCGEARSKSVMVARAVIAGYGVGIPPSMRVREPSATQQFISGCANFYFYKVPASPTGGMWTVKIQYRNGGAVGSLQELYNRSMLVIFNYH